jgi:hypothetical protein
MITDRVCTCFYIICQPLDGIMREYELVGRQNEPGTWRMYEHGYGVP